MVDPYHHWYGLHLALRETGDAGYYQGEAPDDRHNSHQKFILGVGEVIMRYKPDEDTPDDRLLLSLNDAGNHSPAELDHAMGLVYFFFSLDCSAWASIGWTAGRRVGASYAVVNGVKHQLGRRRRKSTAASPIISSSWTSWKTCPSERTASDPPRRQYTPASQTSDPRADIGVMTWEIS